MSTKPKTSRDITNRPTKSAIPRSEGALFLMLNRLATDRERLHSDEANLLTRLDQVHKRITRTGGEMQYYKERIELYNNPAATTPRVKIVKPLLAETESDEEESTQWQAISVEY